MPHNLIDDGSAYPTAVQVPDGSDARTASSLYPGLQALANRAAYLQQLAEVLGVKHLREVADFATLKAIDMTGVTSQELRLVPRAGLYRYDPLASDAEALPWIVAPTVGTGRWVHSLATYAPTNRVLETKLFSAANLTTSAAYPTDIPGAAYAFATATQAGDYLKVTARIAFSKLGTASMSIGLRVSENGGAYDAATMPAGSNVQGYNLPAATSSGDDLVFSFARAIGTPGSLAIKFAGGCVGTGSNAGDQYTVTTAFVELVRP